MVYKITNKNLPSLVNKNIVTKEISDILTSAMLIRRGVTVEM